MLREVHGNGAQGGGRIMTAELFTLPISGGAAVTSPASRPAEAEGVPGPPPSESLTMWDLETNLAALADSVETVEPEQEQQFLEDFCQVLNASQGEARSRGKLSGILRRHGRNGIEGNRTLAEAPRLLRAHGGTARGYVELILRNLGKDAKGKWQKLEGNT